MSKIGILGPGLSKDPQEILSIIENKGLRGFFLKHHSEINESYDLVISLGYNKIIEEKYLSLPKYNVIIFHSSDLPKGRGWAPLYYTIVNNLPYLTLSVLYAAPGVDSGDLIAKANYPITSTNTINDLRTFDDELTKILLNELLPEILQPIKGEKQIEEEATYYKKRAPEDSEIDPKTPLENLYDKIRALPREYPAFIVKEGKKVKVQLDIKSKAEFKKEKVIINKLFKQI